MRTVSFLAPLFWLSSLLAFADHSNSECKLDPNDPYEPSGMMPSGRYQGACLRTDARRSFRVISHEEALKLADLSQIPATPESMYVANFSHRGAFWILVVPSLNSFERVELLLELFNPKRLAGHPMLHFFAAEGTSFYLIPQSSQAGEVLKINSFIFSIEPVAIRGYPISGSSIFGLQGRYAQSYRFTSLDDQREEIKVNQGHQIWRWEMELPPANTGSLFWHLLNDAHDPEMTEVYHLARNNCSTDLIRLIDSWQNHLFAGYDRMTRTFPFKVPAILYRRGLLGRPLGDLE